MRSLLVAILVLCPLGALAQDNHHLHHAYYQNWVNKQDRGCCNNQDCGELRPENERITASGVEVRIDGEWCPVQPHHYLKRGNAPSRLIPDPATRIEAGDFLVAIGDRDTLRRLG